VVFTPVDLPGLPLSGWQRGQRPLPYDVELPPVPTDLDAFLTTVTPSSPGHPPHGILTLPVVSEVPSPIQEFLGQASQSQRILRSFTQEQSVLVSDVHGNVDWLTDHLLDFLRATAEAHRQEAMDLSLPHTLQKQRAWTRPVAADFRDISVTHHQMEEDSDPENIGKQHEKQMSHYRRKRSNVSRTQSLLKQFWEQQGIMKSANNTPKRGKSQKELNSIMETQFRPARDKMRQIRHELSEVSRACALMENSQVYN
jgi:hypothetical protein